MVHRVALFLSLSFPSIYCQHQPRAAATAYFTPAAAQPASRRKRFVVLIDREVDRVLAGISFSQDFEDRSMTSLYLLSADNVFQLMISNLR